MNGQVRGLLQPLGVVRLLPIQQPCAPDPPSTEVLCSGIPSPEAWTNLGQLGEGLAGFSQMQVSRGNDQEVCGGSRESQGMAHPDGIVNPLPPPPERALPTAPRPSSSFRPASDFSALDHLRSSPPTSMKMPYARVQETPGFQSGSTCYPTVCPWVSHLTSLCPTSCICKDDGNDVLRN